MNDFDYENLQKKRVAAGAARMKRGSKSKKCTLLSDYLTPAQLKAKNGEVKTMNMNQPVLWADFKEWPEDLQKEYLNTRMKDFDCTMAGLAEIFDVDVVSLRKTMVKIGFDMSRFVVGRKMTKDNRARMLAWIKEHRGEAPVRQKIAKPAKAHDEPAVEATPTPAPMIEEEKTVYLQTEMTPTAAVKSSLMKTPFVKMDFLGKLNPAQIANTLLALAKDCDVKVSLTLEYQEV